MKNLPTLPLLLLLLLLLLLPTNAHPLHPRNTTIPSISCAISHSSPETAILRQAATVFTSTCDPLAPPSVPTSQACITLMQDTGAGFTINLCGWEAVMADCADTMRAVEALVSKCDKGTGKAAGEVEWEWGIVSIMGVVVGNGS